MLDKNLLGNKLVHDLAYEVAPMNHIGLHEAKTRLSEIIAQVCEGNEYTITRRGIPVARLIPAEKPSREAARQALERARKLRETLSLDGLKIKDLIEEGRR